MLAACLRRFSVLKTTVLGHIAILFCVVAVHTGTADRLIYGGFVLTMADEETASSTGYVQIRENKISSMSPTIDMPSHAGQRIDTSG